MVFEKEVISHSNIKRLQLKPYYYASESIHILCNKGVFLFIIFLQLRWPIESKFSQVSYLSHMLGYVKWEYLSLTITKRVQCFWATCDFNSNKTYSFDKKKMDRLFYPSILSLFNEEFLKLFSKTDQRSWNISLLCCKGQGFKSHPSNMPVVFTGLWKVLSIQYRTNIGVFCKPVIYSLSLMQLPIFLICFVVNRLEMKTWPRRRLPCWQVLWTQCQMKTKDYFAVIHLKSFNWDMLSWHWIQQESYISEAVPVNVGRETGPNFINCSRFVLTRRPLAEFHEAVYHKQGYIL